MSGERFTLDTNILVYSVDRLAGPRHLMARRIMDFAPRQDCWLTLQAVSEFYAAASRKGKMPSSDAAAQAADWIEIFPALPASAGAVRVALTAASLGRASYWDALLIATAAEGGCGTILSEDMQNGGVYDGVRVLNPFGDEMLTAEAARLLGTLA